MLRSATTWKRSLVTAAQPSTTAASSAMPVSSSSSVTPSARTWSTNDVSVVSIVGELQALLGLLVRRARRR